MRRTQQDHVTEELGVQPEYDVEEIRSPGIAKLHEKSVQDMGEILAIALKSRPIVTAVHITRKVDSKENLVKEKVAIPGMKQLHQQSSQEQGDALALIWKSKPKVVGLHYIPGDYIELVTCDAKAGDTTLELVTARLNR